MLPWQPILGSKSAIGLLTFIRRLGIPKRSRISQFGFKKVHSDDLATLDKKLMKCVHNKRFKGVHPLVDQQFSYVRLAAPLLDACRAISTRFCFTDSIGGVSAMSRGLHTGLCQGFLVLN